jgi:hypothetical protein
MFSFNFFSLTKSPLLKNFISKTLYSFSYKHIFSSSLPQFYFSPLSSFPPCISGYFMYKGWWTEIICPVWTKINCLFPSFENSPFILLTFKMNVSKLKESFLYFGHQFLSHWGRWLLMALVMGYAPCSIIVADFRWLTILFEQWWFHQSLN